jgi:hypothetical protein
VRLLIVIYLSATSIPPYFYNWNCWRWRLDIIFDI